MNRDLLIFFQAPAELPYVIQLYDKYKVNAKITIIVVNVLSNYEFIQSLNLTGARILFCEWPTIKVNILVSFPYIRKSIYNFWNSYLSSITCVDVFFFSASFDWVTAFFIRKLCTQNNIIVRYAGFNTTEVILKEGYDTGITNKGLGIREYLILFALKLITGIWFDYNKKVPCISFPYFKYGINHMQIQLRLDVIEPYKYKISSKDENIILLFTTTWDYEGEETKNRVDNRICEIVKDFQASGYKVVAKGHPRLGLANNIQRSVDEVLPNYVPAEFIDVAKVKMIIGLNSAAIIHYAKHTNIKVVSLLRLIEGISGELVDNSVYLMQKMCDGKIYFPISIDELKF